MLGDSLPNLDFMQSTSSLLEPVRLADDTKRFIGVESKTSKLNPHKYYCVDLKYNIKLRTHLQRALKFSRLNQPCSPKFRKLFCQLLLQLAQMLSLFKAKSMTSVYFSVYSGKNSHPQFWCMLWIFFFFQEHMVENEISILRRVKHKNIVELIEEYETPKEIFLVMELVKVI